MQSSANETTINSTTGATSNDVWDQLKHLIVDEHDIEIRQTFFWTDLITALQWLHGADKKQPVLVNNMVAEILVSSSIDQRRHVEGPLNPADIGTREKSAGNHPNSTEIRWNSPNGFLWYTIHKTAN